jgi:hypothetical protein
VKRCGEDFLVEVEGARQLKSRHAMALIEIQGLQGELQRHASDLASAHQAVQALSAQTQQLYVL